MNIEFAMSLFAISQIFLSGYCYHLAKQKGYSPLTFALAGLLPVFNLLSLIVLYLLPEKDQQMSRVYFSKFRQRP